MNMNKLKQLQELIRKEFLLFIRDHFRLAFEIIIPLLLIFPIYFTISSMPYTVHPSQPLWEYGNEFSSEVFTEISPLFVYRNYSDCTHDNRHLLLSSEDPYFINQMKAVFAKNNEIPVLEFNSEDKLLQYAENPPFDPVRKQKNETCAGIAIKRLSNHTYLYKVFINKENIPQKFASYLDPYARFPDLNTFGWLKIVGVFQSLIDSLILKRELNTSTAFISYGFLPMHTNEYKDSFMPLNWYVKVICALPYSVAGISLGFLVWRLQTDQKTLRMFMAFNNFPTLLYHASMLAFFAAFSLADSCIISILLNLFCLETANFVATWVSTFLLLMNVYPYALIISSMFASPLSTSVTSTVVYGLANVIASRYALAASSGLYKIAWSLLPSVAYALCIENLFADNGVLTNYYGYSVAYGWLFMIIDFGVILTIGIILDYILFSGNHDSKAEKLLKESDEQETMLSGEEGEKTGKVFVMYGNLCNINLLNKTARATNKTKYIVFKEGSMLDYLTVKEHFELYSAIVGDKYEEIKQEAEILAGRFELALDKKGKDLTRNQTKLAYIAITLAGGQNNKLLLIEEPTYGVDEKYHQMIYDLIAQIKRQQNEPTIFIATKNEYEAEVLADYLLIYSKRIMAKEWAVPKPYYILKVDTSTRTFAVNEKGAFKEALEELKEEEYSIFYKEGFNFPSKCTDRTFILEEEENSRTNNINNSLLLEKIWAVIWYSWIGTLRDLRMILFEFLIPFSAFALLLVISSYTPSNSYVYSLNDLPKDSTVPINVYTRYNESTEKLFNSDTGLGSLLKIETKHDKSTNIRQIAANFSNSLYFLSNTHASTYLGGYYVVDYNETTLQALIFGNITSPHIPTYFANILSNVYLRHITKNPSAKIITEVVPVDFHREANDQVHDFNIKYLFAIITAMTLLIPLLSMGYTVAKEQTALLRDFQLLNGLKGYEYWTGKALSDFLKLLVLACALIGLHEAFELHIPYFALIVLGSLLPCLLFVYFSALFSKSHSLFFMIAFIVNVCVVIPAGIMLPMIKISTILQQENAILWTILDFLGRLIPLYNLTGTLVCGVFNRLMLEEGHEYFESAFEFHFLGEWLFLLFLTLIGYSAALLLSPTTKQRQFTIA